MDTTILNVRIPNSLAARLAEHKQETLIPTSAFVRRAIEEALKKEGRGTEVSYTDARKLYPTAEIHGTGDYGCVSLCRELISIELGSEDFCRSVAQGPCGRGCTEKHTVERMFYTPIPDIEDEWEDRQRERRAGKNLTRFPR